MAFGKIFRLSIVGLLMFMNFFAMSEAHAEIKIYDGVGEYFMSDETVDFAKEQAELEAQHHILRKISVYIKSQSVMIDHELDSDEIVAVSAGILHVVDTKFSMEPEENFIKIKSFVTAQIDVDELKKLLEQTIKSRAS